MRWLTAPLLVILLACAPAGSADPGAETPGLEQHLHSLRPGGSKQGDPAATFVRRVPDDVLLRRATHKAVFAGCLGYHQMLNGYWTMA